MMRKDEAKELDRTVPPAIQPTTFTFRKPVDRVLRNGIPLHVIEASRLGAVRIDFVFDVGQFHQARKLQALFACRLLREGCSGYNAAQFAERLDYYGAWLDLSVATNRTFVTLYTLKKHFASTLELVQRMITAPAYDEEQFSIVRANNKAQLMLSLQKGDVLAMRALRTSIYGEAHPCGMNATPEDYDTLQVTDVIDYYRQYYGSRSCSIYLSGDVDDAILGLVEEHFGNVEWGNVALDRMRLANDDWRLTKNRVPNSEFVTLKSAVQDSIRLGGLMMDVADVDYLPMRVLTTVLGGYFGSRLMKNVREEKGYTYHIGADLITNTPQVMFLVHCEGQAGKSNDIIAEVQREMQRLQCEPISDAELSMVRNYMTGEICRNYESAFSLADAYIFVDHLGLPLTHMEETLEVIRTVDSAQLQQLAQRYLHPEQLHTIVVGAVL